MTDKVVIMVTASSRRECRKIARRLVELRLAACVNITQKIESIYRWEGKVAQEKEYLMLIKSTRALAPRLQRAIVKLHSYMTPEIICLPIVDGSPEYLEWIGASVKSLTTPETPATGKGSDGILTEI